MKCNQPKLRCFVFVSGYIDQQVYLISVLKSSHTQFSPTFQYYDIEFCGDDMYSKSVAVLEKIQSHGLEFPIIHTKSVQWLHIFEYLYLYYMQIKLYIMCIFFANDGTAQLFSYNLFARCQRGRDHRLPPF